MTSEQFELWRLASMLSGGVREAGVCTDCTPEYREEMQKKGKCLYGEYIQFRKDEKGNYEGFLIRE